MSLVAGDGATRAHASPDADDRDASATTRAVAEAVLAGLGATPKTLPPWLFYDDVGSALYERITELDEYYLTRTERAIFARHAADLMALAFPDRPARATVVELGAGSADKTVALLRALSERCPDVTFVPVDVSAAALALAGPRVAGALPTVAVRPFHGTHDEAFAALAGLGGPRQGWRSRDCGPVVGLFIGSSIGNYDDPAAVALLGGLRRALGDTAALVLGTDLAKDPAVLVPAYDDALGVTAAFDKNVLARVNRELGGGFALDRFRHVARWNAAESRIEMHLASVGEQVVWVEALGRSFHFADGETIHTESSVKYDRPRVERILDGAGWARVETFEDDARRFAVHLARARA